MAPAFGPKSQRAGRWGRETDCRLTAMHERYILSHMRTTIILDDELVEKAKELTGLTEKTAVVHAGLRALIARESARRLAALGGTERGLRAPRRRRPGTGGHR